MSSVPDFDYAKSRKHQRQQLREAILAAAARLVTEGGITAMSVRALSAEVGASTKVIYSHFGGKAGIVTALYENGFDSLTERFRTAAAGEGTILERLLQVAAEYRSFALTSPHLYELMFGPHVRDLLPTSENRNPIIPPAQAIASLFEQGQRDGTIQAGDPLDQTRFFWSAMHGTISLELTNWFTGDDGARRHLQLVTAALASLQPTSPG
jgi:AcrR family transcriptional regulator